MSLNTSLTHLGLNGRLLWWEISHLLDLAAAEMEEALSWERWLAREDVVELAAIRRFDFYRQIGGTVLPLAAFRAKVRHELATGEHV